MNDISPQRRKVAVLCASVGSFAAASAAVSHSHPRIGLCMLAGVALVMVLAAVEFIKLKKEERAQ